MDTADELQVHLMRLVTVLGGAKWRRLPRHAHNRCWLLLHAAGLAKALNLSEESAAYLIAHMARSTWAQSRVRAPENGTKQRIEIRPPKDWIHE